MAEEVRMSPDGNLILVVSDGKPSLGEMRQTLAAIADLRRTHGIERVLVDSRARSDQPPVSDLFQGGEMLARELGPNVRIAVLVASLQGDHVFFENVAVNRGARVAFFEDEHVALRWIAKQP